MPRPFVKKPIAEPGSSLPVLVFNDRPSLHDLVRAKRDNCVVISQVDVQEGDPISVISIMGWLHRITPKDPEYWGRHIVVNSPLPPEEFRRIIAELYQHWATSQGECRSRLAAQDIRRN